MTSDTPPSGVAASGSTGAGTGAPLGGVLGVLTGTFGKGVAGYAALLVFSLATITGSMYVLSTRETGRAIRAVAQFEGSSFEVQTAADFQADSGAKTGVVQFENGTVKTVREAITNLAGAIRAVSSTLVDEARREDAARAAAQSARASAFGLSADTQLAVQAPALSADTLRSIAQGNTAAVPTVVPTTAPSTASGTGPGTGSSAPTAPPTVPPSQPTSIAIIPATAPPAAATSAPPPANPTATPAPAIATSVPPTQTPRADGGSSGPTGPSAPGPATVPTQAPSSSEPSAAAPTAASAPAAGPTAAAQPTTAFAPTAIPPTPTPLVAATATFVPTAEPTATARPLIVDLAAIAQSGGTSLSTAVYASLAPIVVGDRLDRQMNLQNGSDGPYWLKFSTQSTPGNTILWTDTVNGLQLRVCLDRAPQPDDCRYEGPVRNAQNLDFGVLESKKQLILRISVTMPYSSDEISNRFQGLSEDLVFVFNVTTG